MIGHLHADLPDAHSAYEAHLDSALGALPYGLITFDPAGTVVHANAQAHALLPSLGAPSSPRCSELLACREAGGPCEHGCLMKRAASSAKALPEVRIDAADCGRSLWVTFAPLLDRRGTILHIRPGQVGDRRRYSQLHYPSAPKIRITAFGRTQVDAPGRSLDGRWLAQRPGQLLKYLVCRRTATVDEIAGSIWPGAGREALGNARYVVHRLRDRLDPDRSPHAGSSVIVATEGGYVLDGERVSIDVDDFEQLVGCGSDAMQRLDCDGANQHFERAVDLYRGEFLADELYADWAYDERIRLGERARYALRLLIILANERHDTAAALKHLRRLVELEPLDSDVCRQLVIMLLRQGHRSEAKRRYLAFSNRLRQEFDEAPGFDLRSLAARAIPSTSSGSTIG